MTGRTAQNPGCPAPRRPHARRILDVQPRSKKFRAETRAPSPRAQLRARVSARITASGQSRRTERQYSCASTLTRQAGEAELQGFCAAFSLRDGSLARSQLKGLADCPWPASAGGPPHKPDDSAGKLTTFHQFIHFRIRQEVIPAQWTALFPKEEMVKGSEPHQRRSSPPLSSRLHKMLLETTGRFRYHNYSRAGIAQLVEHRSRKAGVIGSSPIAGSSCSQSQGIRSLAFFMALLDMHKACSTNASVDDHTKP